MQLKDLGAAVSFLTQIATLNKTIVKSEAERLIIEGALTKNAAAMAGSLAAAAPYVAALAVAGLAIAGIAAGIKAYREAHPTLEMLQKDADAAKQEFDEMQSKVDETKKRIDELNKLKESGGLSSTEQAELDNLTSQNEQYERQLELLRQIAEYKQDTADKKANDDAVSALNRFLNSDDRKLARQDPDRAQGMTRVMLESHKNGLGGLLNAIDDYTAASEKLETANKALSDAELDKADDKTLDGLRDGIADAEKELNKQREILSGFQDFLIGIRGNLTDKESIATVDSWLDAIATVTGTKDSEKTFDNFKKGLKQLGDDADDVVQTFLKGGKLTEDQAKRLSQRLNEMGYSAEDTATYFTRMAMESSDAIADMAASSIGGLSSLRDELQGATADLEAYNSALEGGEKGDAAAKYAEAYKKAISDLQSGKNDTNAIHAAADLLFSDDTLKEWGYDLAKVGQELQKPMMKAIFSGDGDYGVNFANYSRKNADLFKGKASVTDNGNGTFDFAYSSISDLAKVTGLAEGTIVSLMDALDAFGVQSNISSQDMANLAGKFAEINTNASSTKDAVAQFAQQLADEGRNKFEISSIISSLQASGAIGNVENLNEIISKTTTSVNTLDQTSANPEIGANTSGWDSAYAQIKEQLADLSSGVSIPVSSSGGVKPSGKSLGARAAGGIVGGNEDTVINELGQEAIVRDGKAYFPGNGEPTIVKLKKDDIVLTAEQTKPLLSGKYSRIPIRSAANGFNVKGFGGETQKKKLQLSSTVLSRLKNYSGSTIQDNVGNRTTSNNAQGGGSDSKSSNSDNKQKKDWIEIAITRIEYTISSLDKIFKSSFKSLTKRLTAAKDEAKNISSELSTQQKAYDRYIKEANSVGLSADLASKVRNGTIDINEYDGDTAKLISDYQTWYEKALDCKTAIDDLHESLSQLYQDQFEAVQSNYDNRLEDIGHRMNMHDAALNAHQEAGYMASVDYYGELAKIQKQNISVLNQELSDLNKYFKSAMASGEIEEGSEAWYDMRHSIMSVEEAIADANKELVTYANTMREIEWSYFDYAQDRMSKLTDEAEFFIDLMSNSKLFGDDGRFNSNGMATLGMHAVNYDTYMQQADNYAKEMQKIEKELASDPYNTNLIERRDTLLQLQRDSILAAEQEKSAVASLVQEGFNKELDSLKDLIDSYEEALDSAKDLYEYEKRVTEKTANIATIQKQLSAYANDTSEENRSRVQKLQKQLSEAEDDLRETEYDKYVSDSKKMLDSLYTEYEDILNSRMDDIDSLFNDMIATVNVNADTIKGAVNEAASKVGYSVSDVMKSIWGGYSSVSAYGDLSNVNSYLATIQAGVIAMANANGANLTAATKKYATGGLVDYTGLAQVDGTPGKPELMLDARDTRNFLDLKDILRDAQYLDILSRKPASFSSGGVPNGGGVTIGDINFNVQADSYEEILRQAQRDPKFEKLIHLMTDYRYMGGSKLKKYSINF